MATVHDQPSEKSWLSRVMTTDFCPWANRFVYWLKEPVGWFALATAVSVMVGIYFSSIGWTLAASLLSIMAIGMVWPLVAVYVTTCELKPEINCVHEDDSCRMRMTVRNRIPVPVWGLAVEGFLDTDLGISDIDAENAKLPTAALACVPPLCTSQYHITVKPKLRGHYPVQQPNVACSFPFGIWTARRKLPTSERLTVWPKVFAVAGTCPIVGVSPADHGEGQRGGRTGDFVGVRDYRRGDSAKHVNWVASARVDSLIVTERGGPQSVEIDVLVDTAGGCTREQLADRIRVAASVLLNLHQARVPIRLMVGSRRVSVSSGAKGRRQMLDALADVPADGDAALRSTSKSSGANKSSRAEIVIASKPSGDCEVRVTDPAGGRRAGGKTVEKRFDSGPSLVQQVEAFWTGVRDADVAA